MLTYIQKGILWNFLTPKIKASASFSFWLLLCSALFSVLESANAIGSDLVGQSGPILTSYIFSFTSLDGCDTISATHVDRV